MDLKFSKHRWQRQSRALVALALFIIVLLVISYFVVIQRIKVDKISKSKDRNCVTQLILPTASIDPPVPPQPPLSKSKQSGNYNYEEEYSMLSNLADVAGTDKAPSHHNYTRIYARLLGPLRYRPLRLLELGIDKGASVRLWESYLAPESELHFVDISTKNIQYFSKRSHYHYLDQKDRKAMTELGTKHGPFDVIIDDAAHVTADIIEGLEILLPYVRPGGMYIIEDMHALFWGGNNSGDYRIYSGAGDPVHPGLAENSAIHYLRDRVERLYWSGARTAFGGNTFLTKEVIQEMDYFTRRVDSIQFYNSLAVLLMRDPELV